ncbi:MAG: hypothetical protein EOP46_15105 [Sphingobacteriaceae bacterium]|nr:MAG: hypothetical protein EOP46_15105 [Sphingobacteriaceae bacterium]
MKRSILLLTIVTLLFSACKDDDNETLLKSARIIRSYKIANQPVGELVNYSAAVGTVTVFVEPGADVSAVKPNITVSDQATITPASGETVDLSNGKTVKYTVKAQSGLEMDWEVTALTYEEPEIKTFTVNGIENNVVFQLPNIITVNYQAGSDITAVAPVIGLSQHATVAPASGTAVNFQENSTQTYTVTHPTGQQKTYVVKFVAQ